MWSMILIYAFPALLTLYGVYVLAAGQFDIPGTRPARGAAARLLGALLVSALPLAILLGPLVRIGPFAPRPDFTGYARDAEITREILEQHRRFDAWRKENAPGPGEPLDGLPIQERTRRRQDRARALQEFNAESRRRAAEVDARVKELRDERARLREEREAGKEKQKESAGRSGPLWVGVGVLLAVWALAWLVGRPHDRAEPPPPDEPAPA